MQFNHYFNINFDIQCNETCKTTEKSIIAEESVQTILKPATILNSNKSGMA